ncbi:serine/threonine-protein kinase [Pseudonocardia asaccharolytica]|uniref:serine/threonine-protein kinase n=1 Tax=Pseudonocardia asaccharolytica TaxID=54010 RepID=UPI00048BBE0C|nr:serine/threonine-protein kinase [Pseudonocardia asaccharolytica]
MDALTALLAGLLNQLRPLSSDVCPGGWAWAVSMLGIGVGLLPTAGTVGVAIRRKRIGSRYGVGESVGLVSAGVLTAGLLPLLAFTAIGEVFATAAAGERVPGLSRSALRTMGTTVCLVGSQDTYLGRGTVAAAFDPSRPVRFGVAVLLLAIVPLLAALLVAAQARLALRRGPSWPARFFWLPVLALTVLTARTPAGSTQHLWIGVAAGALLGIVLTAMVGAPSREVVRRSLAPPPAAPAPAGQRIGSRPGPAGGTPGIADRLAERFAGRAPEPVVALPRRTAAGQPRPLLAATPGGPVPGAAPPPPAQRAHPPTLVAGPVPAPVRGARFRLIRRLGAGGFGRVWLAHDARSGQTVALKAAHAPDPETEQRVQREAAALAAVRHPNCIRIHDLVHASSDPGLDGLEGLVIVMEYVEGSPLGQLVHERGPLDDVSAARVWSGIAGALHAAHQRGVLHRDIKPANVIVDPNGLAHLIDFGIARRTGDVTLTAAGFVLGTPDFLAPEVAGGAPATPASDGWQLAATVSYALTGHPPRGAHPDAVSGLRAAATGAKLTHLPRRSAHMSLLKATLRTEPSRRPDLPSTRRSLDEWLRRNGVPVDGPVTTGLIRR